jgi:hypothetical protein
MRRFGLAAVLSLAPAALAGPATAFQLLLSNADFATAPEFGVVENFSFEIDLAGPLVAGASYDNDSIVLVQYLVRGRLSTNPPTPSGFSGFRLDRFPSGEGPISAADWIGQGSSIAFEVAASANLSDGLQLSELVPGAGGLLFELDAREFERLDRARYHPPLLQLFENGTGVLQNSNNSSGSTGTCPSREPVCCSLWGSALSPRRDPRNAGSRRRSRQSASRDPTAAPNSISDQTVHVPTTARARYAGPVWRSGWTSYASPT